MRCVLSALSMLALSFSLVACSGGGGGGGGTPSGTLLLSSPIISASVSAALGDGPGIAEIGEGIQQLAEEFDFSTGGTFDCPGGGSYTVDLSGNPADSGTVAFRGCEFDFGGGASVLDGTIAFRLVNDSTVDFTIDLTAVDGNETVTVFGDMRIELRTPTASTLVTILSGKSLAVSDANGSAALENYRFEETANMSTGRYMETMRGYVRNSSLGGSIYFTTTSPLSGDGMNNPDAGRIELHGAAGSMIALTAVDEDIACEFDSNGDGRYEERFIMHWGDVER